MNKIILYVLTFFISVHTAAFAADDTVLAKFGDKKITVKDFEMFISSFPPERKKALAENPKNIPTLLKRLVEIEVLADVARKKGLQNDPRVRQQIDYFANEVLQQELLRQEASGLQVTEEDKKLYYKVNIDKFTTPEMIRARHILVQFDKNSTDDAKRAAEKTEGLLKRIKAGEDFEKLASEFSDDTSTRKKGGDLGFFPRGKMVKPFEDAVFALKPGEVTDRPVESKFGNHIIRADARKEAVIEPYEKVQEKIKELMLEDLRKTKTKEVLEKAMREAGAEIHPELIPSSLKK